MSVRPMIRLPSLKYLIGGLAVGAILMPFVVLFILSLVLLKSTPQFPISRLQHLSQELISAITIVDDDSIRVRPGYRPSKNLNLVIEDLNGVVIFSSAEAFSLGSIVTLDEIAAVTRKGPPVSSFFSEIIHLKSQTLGHYFAWYGSDEPSRPSPGPPIFPLILIGLVVIDFGLGVLVATLLARSVIKLERAAERIAGGDLETAVVGVDNIREIKELAEAMDDMRVALREDRDKRARFLAAVSHDLRTPLTSIGGYLEAIEDGMATSPEVLARFVRIISDKTRILETRIASIIEFARMETGEWRMGFEEVALRDFLEEIARELCGDALLMGRAFQYDLTELGSFRAKVDKVLLARAIENLVVNAIRYSPAGGDVLIETRSDQDFFYVHIDDEGPGIAPPEREKIFEPFTKGSNARVGEGSGLGLYIVRSVVRGHGWEVFAASSPRGGGRFTIRIPRTE
jgi:signal transduction histidine kinase